MLGLGKKAEEDGDEDLDDVDDEALNDCKTPTTARP